MQHGNVWGQRHANWHRQEVPALRKMSWVQLHDGGKIMRTCGFCGTSTSHFELRWYKYDNGEQFREAVCIPCADQHALLINK